MLAVKPETNERGWLHYQARGIGYGVEEETGEYTFQGRDMQGRYVFDSFVMSDLWSVIVRDESGGIRGDFAITASTPAMALHETARNLAHDQTGAQQIELHKVTSKRIYLFEDEIVEWSPAA